MSIRTDLALESAAPYKTHLPKGVKFREEKIKDITVTHVEITTKNAAILLERGIGHYITIEFVPDITDAEILTLTIAKELQQFIPDDGCILIVGLGNDAMTADALGPRTIKKILTTRHLPIDGLRSVAALAPGVLAQTGVESSELVNAIVRDIMPTAVIVIDAMAAKAYQRLGRTIQIADSGILPGAGVDNARKELSYETLGVPVISIGIPTVVDGGTLACELLGLEDDSTIPSEAKKLTVTSRDIDAIIARGAKHLSLAINLALQPTLTLEDIEYLVS